MNNPRGPRFGYAATSIARGGYLFPERTLRAPFKHTVELVDRDGEMADLLATFEAFLLLQATYEAARQREMRARSHYREA
jgi:hypothetical protein